jgi:hypothetical protein
MPSNIPNEQKQIFQEKMQNRPPQQEIKPTISLEYYQPQPKKPPVGVDQNQALLNRMYQPMPFIAPPMFPGGSPYGCFNGMYPPGGYMTPPVVVKNYTIQTDGINGDHKRLAMIYEDVLPQRKFTPSYTTLGERLNDYQFIRATIFNNSDGKDIDLHGMSTNSLNSFIKVDVGDVNPFNSYKHSLNPYKGLAYGFLLFRSCYPIKHVERTGLVGCAKNSTALNIRVYKMLEGSFYVNKINKGSFFEFDEWREVAFYEYIKKTILEKKICPNFPTMYGYFISMNSLIDYDKIIGTPDEPGQMNNAYTGLRPTRHFNGLQEGLIVKSNCNDDTYTPPPKTEYVSVGGKQSTSLQTGGNIPRIPVVITNNPDQSLVLPRVSQQIPLLISKELKPGANYISTDGKIEANINMGSQREPILSFNQSEYSKLLDRQKLLEKQKTIVTIDGNKQIIQANPDAYLGKSLVILTESPTHSVFSWASKIYQTVGNVYEMINRGVHTEEEWTNVFFQIMVGLHVMQINNLYFDNFKLERNVFIKDLPLRGTQTDFWKYKIEGVDYYIPNLGYLVILDSNYRDLDITQDVKFTQQNKNHKLNGNFFGENKSDEEIKSKAFDMFKACFDSNIFGPDFTRFGGVPPPSKVIDMLGKIMGEAAIDPNKLIGPYILKHMKMFLHNRVGTYLKESEISNKRNDAVGNFKKGEMVILEEGNGKYKFVLYVGTNDRMANIITKKKYDDKDYDQEDVPVTALLGYLQTEPIQQIYKPNEQNLGEENLLETYIIPT